MTSKLILEKIFGINTNLKIFIEMCMNKQTEF